MGSMSELVMTAVGQIFDGAKDVSFTAIPPQALWITVFGTIGAIIVGVLGLLTSINNSKKIQEVHVLVNNQLKEYKEKVAEILALEKQKSRDEGIADQKDLDK